jgi:predicted transposase YbfD/YdcC
MDASAAALVLRLAAKVADPRRHNRLHPLPQMLVMALIAILCGCDGWEDIAEFCQVREAWFKGFLSLPHGIPSHDTFGRVLDDLAGWKGSQCKNVDAGHGRIETRQVWVTSEVNWLGTELLALWPGIKAVAAVERTREVKGREPKVSVERHYYILTNARCTAERVGEIIRGHWAIENSLHHVLDVSFNEDQSRVRKGHGAENLSRLRRLTANLLQQNKSKRSIRGQRKNCAWSEKYLFETLLRGLNTAKTEP